MNNDSSGHSCGTHERSAATLRQTDGATQKPTQQNDIMLEMIYISQILNNVLITFIYSDKNGKIFILNS